jgi:hypothetical protein
MRRQQPHRTMARAARRPPVACFYCDQRFNRTQERATHIRHHHPGKPYRPDLETQVEEPVAAAPPTPPAEPAKGTVCDLVLAAPKPGEWRDEDMTPKQHLVAAIASIKRRQETIAKEAPELEKQLGALRAAQKQMDTERQALEQALATIDGDALEAIQAPGRLAVAGD